MTDPNVADLPDITDDAALQEEGMLPQTAEEGVKPTTSEVDADDLFGGGSE